MATGRALWDWVASPTFSAIVAGLNAWSYALGEGAAHLGIAVFFGLVSVHDAISRALAPGNVARVEINYGSPPSGRAGERDAPGPEGARW